MSIKLFCAGNTMFIRSHCLALLHPESNSDVDPSIGEISDRGRGARGLRAMLDRWRRRNKFELCRQSKLDHCFAELASCTVRNSDHFEFRLFPALMDGRRAASSGVKSQLLLRPPALRKSTAIMVARKWSEDSGGCFLQPILG